MMKQTAESPASFNGGTAPAVGRGKFAIHDRMRNAHINVKYFL
jgi:hypothetical protein